MDTIELVGHSGCRLEIGRHDDRLCVIKTSKDQAYNDRLRRQCEKQKSFQHSLFRTPEIFTEHYETELFAFSMEYVNGVTLAEYLKHVEISVIGDLVCTFTRDIPHVGTYDPDAGKIFSQKIQELKKVNLSGSEMSEPIARAFDVLDAHAWEHCMSSRCHGDLTFENIIIQDEKIYLIDFLDSFYDSWMMDVAKLLQDVECRWSYRTESEVGENVEIRLLVFKQHLLDAIRFTEHGEEKIHTIYHMLLVNLLRILPYTHEKHVRTYVEKEILKIIRLLT